MAKVHNPGAEAHHAEMHKHLGQMYYAKRLSADQKRDYNNHLDQPSARTKADADKMRNTAEYKAGKPAK